MVLVDAPESSCVMFGQNECCTVDVDAAARHFIVGVPFRAMQSRDVNQGMASDGAGSTVASLPYIALATDMACTSQSTLRLFPLWGCCSMMLPFT
jgi:hypothetical protein